MRSEHKRECFNEHGPFGQHHGRMLDIESTSDQRPMLSRSRHLEYERVYLPHCKVEDTPFYI